MTADRRGAPRGFRRLRVGDVSILIPAHDWREAIAQVFRRVDVQRAGDRWHIRLLHRDGWTVDRLFTAAEVVAESGWSRLPPAPLADAVWRTAALRAAVLDPRAAAVR